MAAPYVELLSDLLCVGQALAWDSSKKVVLARRPAKFPVTNLLLAVAWSSERLRSVADFEALPESAQGPWWEWLIGPELFRRSALAGAELPERMH